MDLLALEIFDLPTAEDKNPTTSKFATLEEDASITITDTSELFASGDVWSYSFRLNARANAHIMGSVADLHGSRLHDVLDHRRARLWVEGIAIYLGYLRLDDEVEVDEDGNVDVTFESGQKTFDEMIEGAKANQVPMMDDVLIGLALNRKRWTTCTISMQTYAVLGNGMNTRSANVYYEVTPHSGTIGRWMPLTADGEADGEAVQEYPRYIFPKLPAGVFEDLAGDMTEIDCLNTEYPYDDGHPYCNVALCYQRQGYERKHEDGSVWEDYSQEPEPQRGYEVMPANRVNSAPNFYVIYWIRALMKHLGIYIEENQMMDVEDLRRLFFVNTNCAHKEPRKLRTVAADPKFGKLRFTMSGREMARLIPEYFGKEETEDYHGQTLYSYRRKDCVDPAQSKLTCTDYLVSNKTALYDELGGIDHVVVKVQDVKEWEDSERQQYEQQNGYLYKAYASSECFPNVDISEVIKAIEDGFGIRLLFSDDYKRVRIVLLRNVFNDGEIQDIACDVISDIKEENSTRGFRMTYGKTDDTQFYYKGFADKLPHKKPYFIDDSDQHDYSHWNLNADYSALIKKISAFDNTCSVTLINGNAYIIKVDKDAKRYDELHPSLLECAGYMDAEDGDCTGEKETIHEINLGFSPAIMNDVNFENERDGLSDQQLFALFVDQDMRPRRPDLNGEDSPYNDSDAEYPIYGPLGLYGSDSPAAGMKAGDGIVKPGEFAIRSDMYTKVEDKRLSAKLEFGLAAAKLCDITFDIEGAVYEGYRLYLQDNYEPNDNGISPIETKDWGLTLGIMRGSGSDAYVDYGADPDDEENDTWERVAGSSVTAHPDTCDSYGRLWDYDGSEVDVVDPANAATELNKLFPAGTRNAALYSAQKGYIDQAQIVYITGSDGIQHRTMFAMSYSISGRTSQMSNDWGMYLYHLCQYPSDQILAQDAIGYGDISHLIIELDSSAERAQTLVKLCKMAYGTDASTIYIDNGVGSLYGRFSLKLRAEKPNPYYIASLPNIVSTKKEAGEAMTKLYTTSNTNLLTRPLVSNATMRAAGWNCPGDGYATVFSMGYGVQYNNGIVHEILWTPIKENGTVKTQAQLQTYINSFNGLSSDKIFSHDTEHLILDIDTTEQRAEVLHELQALYYAEDGESVPNVNISSINSQYLTIENESLRQRGLTDTFYKEYSYWLRNARICKRTVRMTLAQLLKIDKTKKVKIGDITGFIRKSQYTVSNKTGLGMVEFEIMYI